MKRNKKQATFKKTYLIPIILLSILAASLVFSNVRDSLNNSSGAALIQEKTPQIANDIKAHFSDRILSEVEEPYYCYEAPRKFDSPDTYCTVKYEIAVRPHATPNDNYTEIQRLFDQLKKEGWDMSSIESTHSWHDTPTKPASGSTLKIDNNGAIYINGVKHLEKGVQCNFSASYVSPKQHHKSQDGIYEYTFNCSYQVM